MEAEIRTECVKVASLRKTYGKDITLEKWMGMPNNLYVGRRGRIFIDGKVFSYAESKWANPFTLKMYSLKDSLELYRNHIITSGLINNLNELQGKVLGCWCEKGDCHAKVLVDLFMHRNL